MKQLRVYHQNDVKVPKTRTPEFVIKRSILGQDYALARYLVESGRELLVPDWAVPNVRVVRVLRAILEDKTKYGAFSAVAFGEAASQDYASLVGHGNPIVETVQKLVRTCIKGRHAGHCYSRELADTAYGKERVSGGPGPDMAPILRAAIADKSSRCPLTCLQPEALLEPVQTFDGLADRWAEVYGRGSEVLQLLVRTYALADAAGHDYLALEERRRQNPRWRLNYVDQTRRARWLRSRAHQYLIAKGWVWMPGDSIDDPNAKDFIQAYLIYPSVSAWIRQHYHLEPIEAGFLYKRFEPYREATGVPHKQVS